MRAQLPVQQQQEVVEAAPEVHQQRYNEQKADFESADEAQRAAAGQATQSQQGQRHQPIIRDKMPRPNDPCPCGSGKKFKNCHGRDIR